MAKSVAAQRKGQKQQASEPQTPQTDKELLQEALQLDTRSAQIRFLASKNKKVGEIAKMLGILYQHAYNVLHAPIKAPAKGK